MLRKITDFFSKESSLNQILWLGIALRILVFIVMNPENPDASWFVPKEPLAQQKNARK